MYSCLVNIVAATINQPLTTCFIKYQRPLVKGLAWLAFCFEGYFTNIRCLLWLYFVTHIDSSLVHYFILKGDARFATCHDLTKGTSFWGGELRYGIGGSSDPVSQGSLQNAKFPSAVSVAGHQNKQNLSQSESSTSPSSTPGPATAAQPRDRLLEL